jgi:hypothetical protein
MPVISTTPDEVETWMTAPAEEVLKLQRPLPDSALRIVARGVKEARGKSDPEVGRRRGHLFSSDLTEFGAMVANCSPDLSGSLPANHCTRVPPLHYPPSVAASGNVRT